MRVKCNIWEILPQFSASCYLILSIPDWLSLEYTPTSFLTSYSIFFSALTLLNQGQEIIIINNNIFCWRGFICVIVSSGTKNSLNIIVHFLSFSLDSKLYKEGVGRLSGSWLWAFYGGQFLSFLSPLILQPFVGGVHQRCLSSEQTW